MTARSRFANAPRQGVTPWLRGQPNRSPGTGDHGARANPHPPVLVTGYGPTDTTYVEPGAPQTTGK
jgi:hypothetical protein